MDIKLAIYFFLFFYSNYFYEIPIVIIIFYINKFFWFGLNVLI